MHQADRIHKLSSKPGGLGVSCSAKGLDLAGVPLLRRVESGFLPRPPRQIHWLIGQAYRGEIDPDGLLGGLEAVAQALNEGAIARAMIGAVLLKLPELDWDGAVRIANADAALAKFGFDPDEQRDWRGQWASSGSAGIAPANDHFRVPGRLDNHRLPLLPPTEFADDAQLYDAAWFGAYHEEVKNALAEHLRAAGLIVQTEVLFALDGTDMVARADIVAMAPGDPTTLHIIDVKTGLLSSLSTAQEWVYPSYVHGNIVSSPDPKITAFGYSVGQKLPLGGVTIWYEPSPGGPACTFKIPPTIPYRWYPGLCDD